MSPSRKPSRRATIGEGPAKATLPKGGPTGATGPAGPAPAGTGYVHVTGGALDAAVAAIPQADISGLVAALALKAPLASPALTGTPSAPTAAPGTNTTQLATTAYTRAEIAALVASSPATLDTLNELALALGSDPNFATTMATALAGKATKAWTVLTPTTTGAVNDWAPGLSGHTVAFWNGAADVAPTGIAGGAAGQLFVLKNITAAKVARFAFNSGSSIAANRLQNLVTSAPTPVAAGGWIAYQHTGTDWKLIGHEQGAWVTPPYNAGDFTASGGMGWTVDVGDRDAYAYMLRGSTLFLSVAVGTTSVSVGGGTELRVAVPEGFTAKATAVLAAIRSLDSGTDTIGFCGSIAAGTYIRCWRAGFAGWSVSVNTTTVQALAIFELT